MGSGFDKHLGKYQLKSKLGQGGMGVVYLATDTRLHREVALKILPRQLGADQEAVERFLREARVVARLNHANVVTIHDVDQQRGYCYLVMELLPGGSVQKRIDDSPLSWREATSIIAQVCRGLAAAHAVGLIHRDIKPANIMRGAGDCVKLTDFGLAKIVDEAGGMQPLTRTGTIMGTPQYMSPEQCRGEPLDARSDLYSLGATYYTLLVGVPPYADVQTLQVMFAHCSRAVPDVCKDRNDIPAGCGAIVRKAMAKNRADRFASAAEMLRDLEAMLATQAVNVPAQVLGVPPSSTLGFAVQDLQARPPAALKSALWASTRMNLSRLRLKASRWLSRRTLAVGAGCVGVLLLAFILKRQSTGSGADGEASIILEAKAELPVGNAAIRDVQFAEDGKSVFAGALDGSVSQWDIAQGKVLRKFGGTSESIHAVAVSPRWLAAGGDAKTLWLWRRDNGDQAPQALTDHGGKISALAISPDGRRLAVGTESEVKLYELDDKGARLLKTLGTSGSEPSCYMVMSVAFSADSRWLAATTWTHKRVLVWNAGSGALHAQSPELSDRPMAAAFLAKEEKLAVGLQRRGVVLWDVGRKTLQEIVEGHNDVRCLAVTADGRTAIFVGEWGGTLRLVDLRRGAMPRLFSRTTGTSAITVALSPDGKHLASGGGADSPKRAYLHLFEVQSGKVE